MGLGTDLAAVIPEEGNTMNAMKSIFLAAVILVCAVGCGLWPGGSEVPSDPIEFAIHLATLGREKNWEGMRSLMVEGFREFDLEALEWAVRGQSSSPVDVAVMPGYNDPDSWTVRPFGEATIVQLKQAPLFAFTLRRSGNGDLKFDPGPSALRWASWLDSQYARGLEWGDLDYPSVQGLQTDVQPAESSPFTVRRRALRHDVETVHRTGTEVEVTVRFDILRGLSGKLATRDIRWRTDTADGQAELLWTTALLEKEPGSDSWVQNFSNPVGEHAAPYSFTVGMDDVPPDDEVTIEFNDLTIGDTVFDMALTMPLINVPPDS